jgi:ATPase family associated with various cellular activities (AAA)
VAEDLDEGTVRRFAEAFVRLADTAHRLGSRADSPLLRRLREHLGDDPARVPVVGETFPMFDHVNVQIGLDAMLAAPGRTHELIGIAGHHGRHMDLSELIAHMSQGLLVPPGPVDYVNLADGPRSRRACVDAGLYLLVDRGRKVAVFVRGPSEHGIPIVLVEVAGADRDASQALLDELRGEMAARNAFRGHVLSIGASPFGPAGAEFVELPPVAAGDVVLPPGTLERIERQTVGFSAARERMRAAGRHLKRGMLLHGPPGTGKTLTVRYLAGRLTGHTVLLLSGHGLELIGDAVGLARRLQPSVVVLEDVDLVAEERTMPGRHGFLFELLEGMDGLDGDADVVFLLTTNRPDLLEPALAARPGRVDLAVEIPLPDADGRRRLIELYARGLRLAARNLDAVVERTDGVAASFITELLRKAALLAAGESDGELVVEDRHLDAALAELADEGNRLTRALLGGEPEAEPGGPGDPGRAGDPAAGPVPAPLPPTAGWAPYPSRATIGRSGVVWSRRRR